jgi:hypothetical protein
MPHEAPNPSVRLTGGLMMMMYTFCAMCVLRDLVLGLASSDSLVTDQSGEYKRSAHRANHGNDRKVI